ncbi:DUF885 domain-containing protein [Alteraurantiacibacter aquimixticola]|uniref:DUF885 domain-containing protein n=1 Tax=Alteraurantiacibacter aquimixticola TaxID=2489173 RepID=A0A4T3F3F9_9SPHN|nr:DUF885 domain-containing protein [Alteraurantiacibacter aquimixticola]TIX51796.1 DUF885 domain-containing protein [Alteraurantiacibacter aquimixticola]
MTFPFDNRFTRRQALGTFAGAAAFLTLPACRASGPSAAEADATLDDIAWRLLAHEPERATTLGVDVGEHAALRGALEDLSAAGQQAYAETLRADLELVRATDTSAMDDATRNSFAVVESAYANALEGFALPYGDVAVGSWRNAPYVVIQNVGTYIDLPRYLDSDHPIASSADAEAYLARLNQMPAQLDGELERMQAAHGMGVVPPDFLLAKAIPQMEASLADARQGGGLVESLVRRTGEEGIDGDWQARAEAIVTGPVAAALERQLEELRKQAAEAGSDAGMWARPRGDEYYAWALKASTTTDLSADDIHQIGLDQLEEIHGRMDPILRDLGYNDGTPGQRMVELSKDPRFQFAEGDEGRAQIMEFIEERIDWIRAQMPRAFEETVTANLEVRRLPLAEEPGAPTAYGGAGSKDGSVPGKMWINLRTTDLHRKYDIPTLVHHETIPGHVWEGEYSNQLPLIRSILAFNAFSEGWALYAETLADELGAYDENPAWRLGYLQDQAYRAARLVVDTGMHARRWSRTRASEFFQTMVGKPQGEADNEIDRYCSWPGQACGYKIGHTEMLRQRARAQEALGDAYDLRAYNQAVVRGGNAPLDVLANNVSAYIESAG